MATPKTPDEDKLKRLIYLCNANTGAKYYCGSPGKNPPNPSTYVDFLNSLLKSSPENLLKVLEDAYSDKFLPHKVQVFKILATLLTLEEVTEKIKTNICQLAENLCKSDKDLFQFVKAVILTQHNPRKKLPTTVRKCVARFYIKKNAEDMVKSYISQKSYHGWKHKDLIKFCHIKSDTPSKYDTCLKISYRQYKHHIIISNFFKLHLIFQTPPKYLCCLQEYTSRLGKVRCVSRVLGV